MGKISGSTYIGGMAGIAGGCLSMNYCANLADVEGNGYIAGLIGEVGDSREWTEAEKRSAIIRHYRAWPFGFNTVVGIADAGTTILNNLITSYDAVMEVSVPIHWEKKWPTFSVQCNERTTQLRLVD